MGSVELIGVTVSRGGRAVLHDIDLAVADGERVAMLGPSGSGKTTLLRAVAGVQQVDTGRLRMDGRDVTDVPARDRDVVMINQEASLQPHLDVRGNLGFPLRLRNVEPGEIDARVEAGARTFSLRGLLRRRPRSLAEGERHEVGLARSLVRRGQVLLLDEPLAQIDPGRQSLLLRELIRVQEGYAVTTIVATNDQRVGMAIAHRLAVLDGGWLVQVGTPGELYRRPATTFVAGFVGDPPMNLVDGELRRVGGQVRVRAAGLEWPTWELALTRLPDQPLRFGIRPTDLRLATDADDQHVCGVVVRCQFAGPDMIVGIALPDGEVVGQLSRPAPGVGDRVRLTAAAADVHVFDLDGAAVAHGV